MSPTAQEPNRPNSTRAQQGNRPTATRAQQPQEPNSFKSQAAQEPSRPKSPRGHYYSLLFSALKLVITLYFGGYSYFVLFLILIFYLHYPLIIINNLFPLVTISYYVWFLVIIIDVNYSSFIIIYYHSYYYHHQLITIIYGLITIIIYWSPLSPLSIMSEKSQIKNFYSGPWGCQAKGEG